jgi:ribose transport system substrate-binding protein
MPHLLRTGRIVLVVALGMLMAAAPALAAKKQLAVILGGLDNPFFAEIAAGCAQWTADHPDADYECVATGPKSSKNGADELKLIDEAISGGAVAIAVAPATEGIPQLLRDKAVAIPVITVAGDFQGDDQALRKSWVTSDDYEIGVALAKLVQQHKPEGGTICLQLNTPEARNINARAAGTRDTLSGVPGTESLKGENGWTEIKGCPLFAKDDVATANKQLAKVLAANAKLDAVVLEGGWAMFDPKGFTKTVSKVKKRLASNALVIVSGDALPPQIEALKAGRVQGLIAQLPFQLGVSAADVMLKLVSGEAVPDKVSAPLGVCTAETADTCTAH